MTLNKRENRETVIVSVSSLPPNKLILSESLSRTENNCYLSGYSKTSCMDKFHLFVSGVGKRCLDNRKGSQHWTNDSTFGAVGSLLIKEALESYNQKGVDKPAL